LRTEHNATMTNLELTRKRVAQCEADLIQVY
jgi:hypothetical protein